MSGNLIHTANPFPSPGSYLHALFERARWPAGPRCPRCSSAEIFRFPAGNPKNRALRLFKCYSCAYQFTVSTRTFLHGTHLPLEHWFSAISLSAEVGGRPSPANVARRLGITYKTAWLMCERIQRGRKGRFLQSLLRNLPQTEPAERHDN